MDVFNFVRKNLGGSKLNVEIDDEDISLAIETSILFYSTYGDFIEYSNVRIVETENNTGIVEIPYDIEPRFIDDVIFAPRGILADFPEWAKRILMKSLFSGGGGSSVTQQFSNFFETMGAFSDIQNLMGNYTSWQRWNNNYLKLTPAPASGEKVGIIYYNLTDWHFLEQNYLFLMTVLAHCKIILGSLYQKYSNIPSASGDIGLYSQYAQEGKQELLELKEEIQDKGSILPLID